MSTPDIVDRLLAWSDGAREQGVQDVADGLSLAASEIRRLRAERDEARRMVCSAYAPQGRDIVTERAWDCFKEQP